MRMRKLGLIVVVGLTVGSPTRADEPTAADLLSLVPVIQSSDPQVRSLEVVGSMKLKDAGRLRFRSLYQAPDRYSILISDATDHTPLVYVADRQLLFYDPIRSGVTCLKDCSQRLSLEGAGKSAKFVYGFGRESKTGQDVDSLKLNVKSLCEARTVAEQRIVKDSESRYRLFLIGTDRTTVCSFDATKAQPFESLKIFEKSGSEPVLSVDKFVVDGPLAKEEFQFPDRDRLSKKIAVHELAGNFLAPGAQMVMISKSIRTRFELKLPGLREDQKPPGLPNQTWKVLQRHDQKASATLRNFVPVDRQTITVDKGVKQAASPSDAPVAEPSAH